MLRRSFAASLVLASLVVVVLAGPVTAGDKVPFKGSVAGALIDRIPFPEPPIYLDTVEMTGVATQLGTFELVLVSVVDFRTIPPTAEGAATFAAANGDTVTADFTGSSEMVEPGIVLITSNATITGGTGRFSGAGGSFTVNRLFNAVTRETIGYFEGNISVPPAGDR